MKYCTETYTQLTNDLQGLNREIKQRHLSMPSYTEQEMRNLAVWLEENKRDGAELRKRFFDNLPAFKHLKDTVGRWLQKVSSKD